MIPSLILASGSPRRRDILTALHIPFEVCAADIDETPRKQEGAKTLALRLAKEKAFVISERFPDRWVLAADTLIAQRDKPVGKPKHAADAIRILRSIQGKRHQVHTAVCLRNNNQCYALVDTTHVQFRPMTPSEIRWYVQTGEPMDKAGAYGIQGVGGRFVRRIQGSFSNVMGLPIEKLVDLLTKHRLLQAWTK